MLGLVQGIVARALGLAWVCCLPEPLVWGRVLVPALGLCEDELWVAALLTFTSAGQDFA